MGGKGDTAAPPPSMSAQPNTGVMDPMMMQMLMTMVQSNQQQQMPPMPQAPTIAEPGVTAREAINWQDTLQDMRDKSTAKYDESIQKEAQLVEAFYPGTDEPDSLLIEETDA